MRPGHRSRAVHYDWCYHRGVYGRARRPHHSRLRSRGQRRADLRLSWHCECLYPGMQHSQSPEHNLCSELVYVAPGGENGGAPFVANLEEIAESRAVVLSEKALRQRSKVRIISGNKCLEGIVESCIFEGILGFFLNIELVPESRWSRERFLPKHFLDVKRLASTKGFTLSKASGY